MKNEILLYQSDELIERIEVRLVDDTVWLNRQQIALLFGRDLKTIGKHINNVFVKENYKKIQLSQFLRHFKWKAIEGWKDKLNFTI